MKTVRADKAGIAESAVRDLFQNGDIKIARSDRKVIGNEVDFCTRCPERTSALVITNCELVSQVAPPGNVNFVVVVPVPSAFTAYVPVNDDWKSASSPGSPGSG